MNIMLTDLTSLTLEQAEVSMVVESDTDSFAGMLSQQLPETSEKEIQGVDFKDFLEKLPIQAESSEITPDLPLVANENGFPLYDPGRFSWDSYPGVNTSPEPVDNILKQAQKPDVNGILNASTNGATGELLPIGGNLLPDDAGFEIARQDMFEKTVAPSVTVAAGAEAIRAASSEALLAHRSQLSQAPAVAPPADGGSSLQGATIGVVDKAVAASDFVTVMGKPSVPESDQVIARNKTVAPDSSQPINKDLLPEARFFAEARQPGVAGMMRSPDVETAPPPLAARGSGGVDTATCKPCCRAGRDRSLSSC